MRKSVWPVYRCSSTWNTVRKNMNALAPSRAANVFAERTNSGAKGNAIGEGTKWRGPLAGRWAQILFGAGLFNASLFAASILPLSTAYTVCEGLGFE